MPHDSSAGADQPRGALGAGTRSHRAVMRACAGASSAQYAVGEVPGAVIEATCPIKFRTGRRSSISSHTDATDPATMASRMLLSGAMGAFIGGAGVVVHSVMQGGRMPPPQQVAAAAGFMGTMFGVGAVVRQH